MTFSAGIAAFAKKAGLGLEDATARSLLQLTNNVVIQTPKDQGRAQANWFPSVGTPAQGFDLDKTDLVSQSSINSAISDSIGGTYWLVNNLPYIRRLEYDGHSLQAPNGWVRANIENFNLMLQDAAQSVKK